MSANSFIHLIEVPTAGNEGAVWNRLHSEREDICEAMLKQSRSGFEAASASASSWKQDDVSAANWHRELLQSRLRKIDDALDRLRSGSYGNCIKCGRWIEDAKLEFDPAIAFCIDCWGRELNTLREERLAGEEERSTSSYDAVALQPNDSVVEVALARLAAFDTIIVQTHNTEYRIFLLDPKTGRALLEGGQFVEPVEAIIYGSTLGGSTFKVGWICVGLRLEMWANDFFISASPVRSIRVEHASQESAELLSAAHPSASTPSCMGLLTA